MTQYKALVTANFKSILNNMKGTPKNGKSPIKNLVEIIAVAVLIIVSFGVFMLLPMGLLAGYTSYASNIQSQLFTICTCLFMGLMVILSISYILNTMYFSRDNEFLLALPVKNTTIFLSKLTTIYILSSVFSMFYILFFCIPFGITAQVSWSFYVSLPLLFLLMPILPLFIGTLLSFPFMYIVSYIKKHRYLKIAGIILFIAAFAGTYIFVFSKQIFPAENGPSGGEGNNIILSEQAILQIKTIANYLFFANGYSELFIAHSNPLLSITILLGSNAAFIALSLLLSILLYRRGMAKQLENSGEVISTREKNKYVKNSPTGALLKKELTLIVRNPVLLLYSLLEVVMPVVVVIILSSTMKSVVPISPVESALMQPIMEAVQMGMVVLVGLTFSCGMNYLAVSAVSREGKALAMLKSMPVSILKQLEVKAIFSYCLPVISLVVVSITCVAMGVISILSGVGFFIFSIIIAYAFTYFQVGADVKKPKLDFENITQVLQNNMNALKSMGFALILSIVVALLLFGQFILSMYINPIISELVMWGVLIVLAAILAIFVRKAYLKSVIIDFENIEA